jgi:hypothetical protein
MQEYSDAVDEGRDRDVDRTDHELGLLLRELERRNPEKERLEFNSKQCGREGPTL